MDLIVGIDPGFGSIGVCHYDLFLDKFISGIVLKTSKESQKGVYSADDNFCRCRDIFKNISGQLGSDVKLVCFESMSFMRNASAAAKVAMCHGILASCVEIFKIPVVQLSPSRVRKFLFSESVKQKITKVEIESRVREISPSSVKILDSIIKTNREHVADAMAVLLASLDSDIVRAIKNRS